MSLPAILSFDIKGLKRKPNRSIRKICTLPHPKWKKCQNKRVKMIDFEIEGLILQDM
jgi:hypothetical protein